MRSFAALLAVALLATFGASAISASELDVAREQAMRSGKPLMVVFR